MNCVYLTTCSFYVCYAAVKFQYEPWIWTHCNFKYLKRSAIIFCRSVREKVFVLINNDFLSFSPQEAHFNRLVSRFGQSKSGILPHFFIWIDQEYFNSLNWRFLIIGFSDERKYSKIHWRTVQFKICSRASTQKNELLKAARPESQRKYKVKNSLCHVSSNLYPGF